MTKLKAALQELAFQANTNKIHKMAEMQVQSSYVIKVLELLGWKDSDWKLGAPQEVRTGKIPDIRLHDKSKHTVLVVECKDAKRLDKLDGRYGNKTFEQQLYGYCRAEGINWGILTNFVEWRLYNETLTRLYEDKKYAFLDLLWPGANPKSYVDILSDEGLAFLMKFQRTPLCMAKGKVDTNPVYYPIEKQIEDIKAKFFLKLKGWRDSLRKELFRTYGEKYDKDQIDLFTQKILDRIIFMEVCHDKGIIGQDILSAILNSHISKYDELKKRFKEMDEQFNTELFAPMPIDHFDIGDEVLVPIIKELNEIDFEHVTVHIIGEVYENYLGEMLRVTKKSGLKVQEHKEQAKRKSQGIYYTPEYIVDYIVKNTVGELVKKAQTEDDLKKIKILDPACGSGSFLIKAFDVMYEAYENLKIDKKGGQLETRKDLKIKRLILQHNLYGVDLDDRAVEITKLNLMLKALEGFNYHELKGRKLLPNLNLNIRVGNSLISGQTIEQLAEKEAQTTIPGLDDVVDIKPLLKLHNAFYKEVEDEEKARLIKEIEIEERRLNRKLGDNLKGYFSNLDEIKPLNYQVAFPEVYKQGGFDAVIGNPPYGANYDKSEKHYFTKTYTNQNYQLDSYLLFFEKSIAQIINDHGYFGMIIPNPWMTNLLQQKLRSFVVNNTKINIIVHFTEKVFPQATVDTEIIVLNKGKSINSKIAINVVHKNDVPKVFEPSNITTLFHDQNEWVKQNGQPINIFLSKRQKELSNKIANSGKELSHFAMVNVGIKPYQVGKGKPKQTRDTVENRVFDSIHKIDNTYRQYLRGCDIHRYCIAPTEKRYLKYGPWLAEPRPAANFAASGKILMRQTGDSLIAAFDNKQFICMNNMHVVVLKNNDISLLYILGLLNSHLMNWYYQTLNPEQGEALAEVKKTNVENLPIAIPKGVDIKNKIIKLVKEILKLSKTPELRQRPCGRHCRNRPGD